MLSNYTAKYTKISSGYMDQLVEWPEVITEDKTLEECRELLRDALREMIKAYKLFYITTVNKNKVNNVKY